MAFGDLVAVVIWLGGIHLNGFLLLIEVYWGVYLGHPYGLAAIVLHLTLCFFPTLSDNTPAWASLLSGATMSAQVHMHGRAINGKRA